MKTFGLAALVPLAVCMSQPLAASEFEVVAATGSVEPDSLRAGQRLGENIRLALEPWGRALIRETTKCGLTHVVVGLEEHVLTLADDCSATAEPHDVAGRLQQGEAFAARLESTGAAADLVQALVNEPCVFLPRVSEEGIGSRRCPSGYALRGLRCSGAHCDDKDLLCCPYLEGAPDESAKETQSRWISDEFPNAMTSKKFVNGLACRGPYCDDLYPRQFRSSRLVNTRACEWSAWVSEMPPTWLDCGLGRLVAGIRCRGDYCGDLGIYCCQAEVK